MPENILLEKDVNASTFTFAPVTNPNVTIDEKDFFQSLNGESISNKNELKQFLSKYKVRRDGKNIDWKSYFKARGMKSYKDILSGLNTEIDYVNLEGKLITKQNDLVTIDYKGKILTEPSFLKWITNNLPLSEEQLNDIEKNTKVNAKSDNGNSVQIRLDKYLEYRGLANWREVLIDKNTKSIAVDKDTKKFIVDYFKQPTKKSTAAPSNSFAPGITIVHSKSGQLVPEDAFLLAIKKNPQLVDTISTLYTIYENGTEISLSDYLEKNKLGAKPDISSVPQSPATKQPVTPNPVDKPTNGGDSNNTTTNNPPKSNDAPASPTDKITDGTVDQLRKLVTNIGVTVYDKNSHKKVSPDKIDGRSLNDYVIYLGGKNPQSVRQWIKTLRTNGVLTEELEEDFTADEMTQSGQIYLYMNINSELEDAEFTLDIDEVGQLTITPEDESVSFDGVSVLTKDGNGAFVSVDDDQAILEPTLTIDYTMTSSEEDFTYFATIDDIGQIVITPENDNTSFVSATVGDNLNISAEDETMSLMESLDSVLKKVREETENYTTINGEITVATEEDADIAKTALEMYYDIVNVDAKDGMFVVAYADEGPTIVETLTEDAEDEENLPAWKVAYKFADDIEQDGEMTSATVNAETSEDANKFGEQYARKMALEDDSWKNAKIVSLQLLK